MQKLTYVLFQIDEARRYIEGGRLEQLRLALLLLDNAVEIQLDRRVCQELAHEDLRESIRRQVLNIPPPERSENLEELTKWQPLSRAMRKRLDRLFDEKLTFLSERHEILDTRLVRPLSYLHRYRNEAYHEARVRRETINTAASILIEANCQLLLSVFPVSVYASDEDYSWLTERFGIERRGFIGDEALKHIVESLRSGFVPTREAVVVNLKQHLRCRSEDLCAALDFIVENTGLANRDAALIVSQFSAAVDRDEVDPRMPPYDYKAAWSMASIEALRVRISELDRASDRMDAFQLFAEIEEAIEPIEAEVRMLVRYVDGMIQNEIDRRRGK